MNDQEIRGGARLAVLSAMAGSNIEESLAVQDGWNLRDLDLKDGLFGQSVLDLSDEQCARLVALISARNMQVYCLSTPLFDAHVEDGEAVFRGHLQNVKQAVRVARLLRPRFVRLLACRTRERAGLTNAVEHVCRHAPWVFNLYRDAVTELNAAGFTATIENETGGCILSSPDEVNAFFSHLAAGPGACFTWDVQNLWQYGGRLPSVETYRLLRPLIGYVHLKGGVAGANGRLQWRSTLAAASWPVVEIVREVLRDGVSPVLCLNPAHGELAPGYDLFSATRDDLTFLRQTFEEIT